MQVNGNDNACDKVCYLKKAALFKDLPADGMARLDRVAQPKRQTRGQVLVAPGDISRKIFIIKQGQVKIYRSEGGKRVTVAVLGPGDVFGDFSLALGDLATPNSAVKYFVEMLADAFLCVVSAADFKDLIRAYPDIAVRLVSELSRRLADAEAKIQDLALAPAEARVLHALIAAAPPTGERLTQPATHESVAEATGLTRETVTRALARLRQRLLIRPAAGHRYIITSER